MGEKFMQSGLILFGLFLIAGMGFLWHIDYPNAANLAPAAIITVVVTGLGAGSIYLGLRGPDKW